MGESPRFCNAPDLKAPEGRRQNRASPLRGFRVALQRFRGFSPPAKFLRHFVAEKRNFKKRKRSREQFETSLALQASMICHQPGHGSNSV